MVFSTKTGIIVFGYNRPKCLFNVLKSLKIQNAKNITVSLDAANADTKNKSEECIEIAKAFDINLRIMPKPMFLNLHILNGLTYMANEYERFIVIEDDCFPTSSAIDTFIKDLNNIEKDTYSIYGSHFTIPNEKDRITRFQSWGWATTSEKFKIILPELKMLLTTSEKEYKDYLDLFLTQEIIDKINITPGRNDVDIIQNSQYWDSITSLLCAQKDLYHKMTSKRIIYNCGGTADGSSFKETFRHPPFNMIDISEVWDVF